MTDEQVDRIIQALEGSGESWTTWVIPILTLILGFVLSQLQEKISTRRKRLEQERGAKEAAARAAKTLAMEIGATSWFALGKRPVSHAAALAAVLVPIADINVTVAGWVSRQLVRLCQPPANAAAVFSREEQDTRNMIGSSVTLRLGEWVRGKVAAEAFSPGNDDEWDASVRDLQRITRSRRT